jgi:hypothetical protein
MAQMAMYKSLNELKPVAKELSIHTNEVFSRLFLPLVVFDKAKVKFHAIRMKRTLDKVV